MDPEWKSVIDGAQKATDSEYASQVSSLTRLTDDEISSIAPAPEDKENLARIMGIVADASKSNEDKAAAISNISGALQLVVPLLMKLV